MSKHSRFTREFKNVYLTYILIYHRRSHSLRCIGIVDLKHVYFWWKKNRTQEECETRRVPKCWQKLDFWFFFPLWIICKRQHLDLFMPKKPFRQYFFRPKSPFVNILKVTSWTYVNLLDENQLLENNLLFKQFFWPE